MRLVHIISGNTAHRPCAFAPSERRRNPLAIRYGTKVPQRTSQSLKCSVQLLPCMKRLWLKQRIKAIQSKSRATINLNLWHCRSKEYLQLNWRNGSQFQYSPGNYPLEIKTTLVLASTNRSLQQKSLNIFAAVSRWTTKQPFQIIFQNNLTF